MNLQTIVILSLVFNLSLNALPAVGGNGLPPVAVVGVNVSPITPYNLTSIQQASQCSQNKITLTCNAVVQIAEAFWGVALTFGVFMWGVVKILPMLVSAIVLPGSFLLKVGVDPHIVAIYSFAFDFLYAMWAYTLWTGRYNADIT
jgi:hypothetical protein